MQARNRASTRARAGALVVGAVLVGAGVVGGSESAGADRSAPDVGARIEAAQRTMSVFRSRFGATAGPSASAVGGVGTIADLDPEGDAASTVDITNFSAAMHSGRVRFSAKLPTTPDPATNDSWQFGITFVAAIIDANGDDVADYDAFMFAFDDQWLAGVITDDGEHFLCNAQAGYKPTSRVFSMTVPLRCIGNPSEINFAMGSQFELDPFDDSESDFANDFAPDTTWLTLAQGSTTARAGGGYVVDGRGGVHGFAYGTGAPVATPDTRFPFDIARGIGSAHDGGHAYVVDGFGGLHAVGFGATASGARTFGGPYWPGWDIARGVGVVASGRSGYVLDGFGGLHGFGIGEARPAIKLVGAPYWPGWDIARGVALLPNGTGGFVVDGFGGLHWFSLKRARSRPTIVGNAYWPGQDRARGVTIRPDGKAGFVIDSAGRLHPFGIGGPPPGAPATGVTSARGVTVIPRLLKLPAAVST